MSLCRVLEDVLLVLTGFLPPPKKMPVGRLGTLNYPRCECMCVWYKLRTHHKPVQDNVATEMSE